MTASMGKTEIFNKFPKIRPSLPEGIKEIYESHLKQNREGRTAVTSLSQKIESWLHKQVANDVKSDRTRKTTLEIGAGTLNQLHYEPEVGPYDIIEPLKYLYKSSGMIDRIRNIYSDINEVPGNQKYDRIISIATFEHICNLPEVMARSALLLNPKGTLRVSIPSEGTFLWGLAWRFTTGIEFRIRHGLDYGLLMKYEHLNSAREISALLHYFFNDIRARVFGLGKEFSFYQFYNCAEPKIKPCQEYLAGTADIHD